MNALPKAGNNIAALAASKMVPVAHGNAVELDVVGDSILDWVRKNG